jgi:hypothetical protein
MGIPQSLLWSASAYATARHEDRLTFIEQTVIPQCQTIHEEVLNEQLFGPEGLVLKFHPEKLPIMQDSQLNKAQALSQLVGTGNVILTPDEAREMMGLPPMKQSPGKQVVESSVTVQKANEQLPVKALVKWRDASLKRVKEGHDAAFDFKHDPPIPIELRAAVLAALTNAHTQTEVRSVFAGVMEM